VSARAALVFTVSVSTSPALTRAGPPPTATTRALAPAILDLASGTHMDCANTVQSGPGPASSITLADAGPLAGIRPRCPVG
jgi:hypothetical protein